MARKWTLTLILICLPILATVITAFRVRDLPKTTQDSVKKQKCDDCDVSNKHSVKESARNTHEELKSVIREKQQLFNQKVSEKSAYNYGVSSDESKDDDETNFFGVKTGLSQEHVSDSKVKTEGSKKFVSFDANDEDDDDDDDDDEDDDDDNESDNDGVISSIKKMLIKSDNKPKQNLRSYEVKGSITKDKSNENDSDDDDDDEGEDDDIFVFKKSKVMDLVKTQPGAKSNVKQSDTKFKVTKHADKQDDDDIDDNTSNIQQKITVIDVKNSPPKLKPDLKMSVVKQPIPKTKPLIDDDYEDNNSDSHDIGKSKTKPHIEPLPKIEPKLKVELKPKPVIQEEKKVVTKPANKKDDDADDQDASIEDDADDSLFPKARPKTVTKDQKTEALKKDTIDKKETPKNPSHEADEKFKIDKIPEKSFKPAVSKKVETTKDPKLEDSLTKEDKKTIEKPFKTDKPATPDKPKSAKEEKKAQKETETITDKKPNKENPQKEREKDIGKFKSSAEKDKRNKGHEELKKVELKFAYEPKKIEDLRDSFKPYYKKETKAEPDNKYSDGKKIHKTSKEKLFHSLEVVSTTDSHLKHVTDALHRRNLLKSEFEDLYAFFPTFAPNFSRIQNPECRRHGQIVLRQLRGTKLWALNMLDATAKIPSGILRGNGIQLGDFDQCLGSQARVQLESGSVVKVQGQYCLVRFEVKAEHPDLEAPVYLAQAKNLIRSRIDDPGHFLPRFSTLSWGVCVPAACNPEDVELIVKDAIKHYQHTSGVVLRVKVDEQDCQVEEGAEWWTNWVEWPTVLTLSFYGIIILLVLVATVQDYFARGTESQGEEADEKAECDQKESKDDEKETTSKRSEGFLSVFSLYRTISKLVAPGDTDEISCIHGIRAIATIALLIAHKILPVAVMPYTNRLKITEVVSSPIWLWCRAGWMFTDCFLLLSGTLTAHKISSASDAGAPRRLFSKYLRLTPALLALVLFYAYVWDNITTGPMWGTFVTKNAQLCQEGWWWNLLYVQNYFGFEDMCAPQTHQLALDMQLTVLGGILVWVMQARVGLARILLPSLHFLATYSRYTTVRDHRLTMLAYHGVSGSQLYRTARLSYTSTLHRSTPYLVGLSLGLALQNTGGHNKVLLFLGWLSSGALWCLVWWAGIDSGSTQYRYSAAFAAQYAALAPLASALATAWMIYAVHNGSCNLLSRFLSCRPLVLISRLSYALYLCQFIVFITNVATVKYSSEFTLMSMIDVKEISAIFLLSTILTLTLVIPMQSLHKVFIFSSKPTTEDKETEQNQKRDNHVTEKEEEIPTRRHLIAHREVLEEIPETEVEYELQRDYDQLGEILEEEEDEEIGDESHMQMDDDLEIIEEEAEDEWTEREENPPRRSYANEEDQDLDEWEWTANGTRDGAQLYRYSR